MSHSTARDIHVLIIDDHPEALKPLSSLIQSAGMRLSLITDPRQAVPRAQVLRPDLILLDVHMLSQMDGFAVCRLLQEAPVTRKVPIIFLTSASAVEDRLQGLTLGGVDYVIKPFAPEEVLARIRVHVQLARRDMPESNQPEALPAEQSPDLIILHAAMRLIAQQLDEPPALPEIARLVGTHDKKLSAIFRQHLDMTVFAFIREERLRKSQQLLIESHLSIQDIADLVGFRSAANFATAFRERTGMTPSAFRSQKQGESNHAPR